MNKAIAGALCALLLSTLACTIFIGGPAYPEDTIPTPTGTVPTFEEQLQQALADGAASGQITLQLSEQQLTSYLITHAEQQSDPVIADPRVYLRDGHIEVFGRAQSGIFTANVAVIAQASVDGEGQPTITIEKTDFGPVAAPEALNQALTASVQEAFTGWLGPVATGFRLETITIGNGVMTVTGRIK